MEILFAISFVVLFTLGLITGIVICKKEKTIANVTIIYDDETGEVYSDLHFTADGIPKDGKHIINVSSKHIAKNTSYNMVS